MSKDLTELVSIKMKRLVEDASQVRFIPGGALKIYFRSANTLLRQVILVIFFFLKKKGYGNSVITFIIVKALQERE
jgi:hypothetical protein